MKRSILSSVLAVAIVVFLWAGVACLAEERIDLRDDMAAYCSKVAEINIDLAAPEPGADAHARAVGWKHMVLFRTANPALTFDDAPFEVYSAVYGPRGFSVLVCDEPQRAVEWLPRQPGVSAAEMDASVEACAMEYEGAEENAFQSWGAQALGMDHYIRYAARWGSGSVTAAVVDSGVWRHSLLNPRFAGYGHDYIDNDNDPTNDLNGHGTRVAGIIADCTQGLQVCLFPIRVLDASGNGRTSNVINAVLEATEAKVDIINLSLSTFAASQMLEEAIRGAVESGITVVVAAGNHACDAAEVTPGKMTDEGVIIVGSANREGQRSTFSNYGASVDVYVYGEEISSLSRSGGYVTESGTSMAAPHVTALSAMIKLTHPGIAPAAIERRIKASAVGDVPIPRVFGMIPRNLGFMLERVRLGLDSRLTLPDRAKPESAMEEISYIVADLDVASFADGEIVPRSIGHTSVTVRCPGFDDVVFEIDVVDGPEGRILLPAGLEEIGEGAFEGLNAAHVIVPDGARVIGDGAFDAGDLAFITIPDRVQDIGENTFSGAVILCGEDSCAHTYALENGLQYIAH